MSEGNKHFEMFSNIYRGFEGSDRHYCNSKNNRGGGAVKIKVIMYEI
jgi:hypothetical protein